MKAIVFSYTRRGARLSLLVRNCLQSLSYIAEAYTTVKFAEEDSSLKISGGCVQSARQAFQDNQVIVYIGSCGIAVRAIAPYVKNKMLDPAVIAIDERGRYVIPLLSGHIGGANEIARKIAEAIEAQPVITTATDINGLFAVDEWATKNNVYISSMFAAKEVSSALVDGETVGLISKYPIYGEVPHNIAINRKSRVGLVIDENCDNKPFPITLNLLPKTFYMGIGCRRGIAMELIEELVFAKLAEMNISLKAIVGISSVDLKKDEQGLLAFSDKYHLPIKFFTSEELEQQSGEFTSSDFVKSVVGVSNVCERAAVAISEGGSIVLPKTSLNGVTLAIAKKEWHANFKV
ncbi:MAG: cobalamin biosynthesis protein CbiG [Negativicutes bacterium]|nr:cobalamin biosynthesis protein CbiG [Negativicutes bacterium]